MTGKEAKEIRELYGETQEVFAKRLSRSRKTINSYEKMGNIPEKEVPGYVKLRDALINSDTHDVTIFEQGDRIPFYENFEADGASGHADNIPAYYLDMPEFRGTVSFIINTRCMEKKIVPGSRLFGTKIDWEKHIEFGKIYGIVCNDGRKYLKYIRRHPVSGDLFLLKNENQDYDDMDLPKGEIRSIWLIHGFATKLT